MSILTPATWRKFLLSSSVFLGFLLWGSAISYGAIPENLAAEMITTQYGRQSKALLKIKGAKVRIEVKSGRAFSTLIARYDKNFLWLLHPGAQKYQKMPLASLDERIPHFFRPGLKIEKDKVSEETLAGKKTVKYKVRITSPEGRKYNGFLWESPELTGFPLKWQDPLQGITVEWNNIATRELPPDLFELPENYAMIPVPDPIKFPPGKHQGQHAKPKSLANRNSH